MVKEGKTVGHIPQLYSKTRSIILLSGGSVKLRVIGKSKIQRGNGQEVS